jgi:hypothetical protein
VHCDKAVDDFDIPINDKIATAIESAVVRENATAMERGQLASASLTGTIFSQKFVQPETRPMYVLCSHINVNNRDL